MLSERLDAWLNRHEQLVDGLVVGAAGLVLALPWLAYSLVNAVLSIAILVPVIWRRRRPVLSAGLVLSIAFVHWVVLLGQSPDILPADMVVPFAIYSVTAYGPRWAGRVAVGAGVLGAVLASAEGKSQSWFGHLVSLLFLLAPVLAAWAFGTLRGVRRERMVALQERARLLEVEQHQQARLAVSAERARIAREMHDVVAHSLTVIIAQADGGRYAAVGSPAAAQEALRTIGDTGRRALAEMRRLLGVLREDGDNAPGQPRLPQPGLADLPGLVERVRSGGLPVSLRQEGEALAVEPGLGLVVYRIVQEGLTNVIKHAGPAASAEVTVRWNARVLEIDVLDDGRGAAAPASPGGHGVIGMRERAGAYGGTVRVGPRAGGGHALHARIPVPA